MLHILSSWITIFLLAPVAVMLDDDLASNTAVAVYTPGAVGVHDSFAAEQRHFMIAGYNWTVEQSWDEDGVAGVVWQVSIMLGEHLTHSQLNFTGRRVVELGAGAGLPGLVAAVMGGLVALTDHHSVIHVTKKSVGMNSRADRVLDVTVKPHDWGSSVEEFNPPVDFVLGADIVYLEETFPALLNTLLALTVCDHSMVLLALTVRYQRDVVFLKQFEMLFQCSHVGFDNEAFVLLLHAQKYCVSSEKILHSCTKTIDEIIQQIQ